MPQISVITGASAGGGCYSPALTDFVVMTEGASMFLTGPAVVREVMGEDSPSHELGGPRVHRRNGVCHFVGRRRLDAIAWCRELLSYLPASAGEAPRSDAPAEPRRATRADVVPADGAARLRRARRDRARSSTAASCWRSRRRWARNMVTAFARIDGRPVGVVANQPRYLGGVIDADASQKGARFVRICNAFGLPLVVLVDTPGFLPGTKPGGARA